MPTDVVMPQMGESIAEGTITRWLVKLGDRVEQDQPLFEITTDKVDAEIPSPASGTLVEIRHQEGETVDVDTVVAVIAEVGTAAVAVQAASAAAPEAGGTGTVGVAGDTGVPAPSPPAGEVASPAPEGNVVSLQDRLRRFSSPLVRSIAAREGVNLHELAGTGIQGRVTKADILQYLENRRSQPEQEAPAKAPAAVPAPRPAPGSPLPEFSVPAYREGENVVLEPMSRIRQVTAAHMVYSRATSAHVTTVFHMDMSRVVRVRNQAKDGFDRENGTKLTYMPFIFQATLQALKAYPKLNAAVDGSQIVYKKNIHLGMAVAMEQGLIVPVIHDADELNLVGLAKRANDLAERARSRRLKPEEAQGGTFTVTNPGAFGGLFGTPIINQPQVAILGIGTIEKRPVVLTADEGDDTLAIRSMSYFALSFDHRIIDGADAELFLAHIKKTLAESDWSELAPYTE